MQTIRYARAITVSFCATLFLLAGCNRKKEEPPPDHPRLTPKVAMRDVTFHSVSLNRETPYRVVLPAGIPDGRKLQAVYLLHGGGGGFRDWTNYSDVASYAEHDRILIMPEGDSSYYTNSAERLGDRYEDYIAKDLITEVESRFPVAAGRENRAIVGVSMGGFGAVKLALKHPEVFGFAAGLSPAIDVPSRPFSIKRIGQWRFHRSIFGTWGSQTRRDNDPFVLARSADPDQTPYLFLTCGEREGLLPANRAFTAILAKRNFQYEFHTAPAGHDWNQWNGWLPQIFQSMVRAQRTNKKPSPQRG